MIAINNFNLFSKSYIKQFSSIMVILILCLAPMRVFSLSLLAEIEVLNQAPSAEEYVALRKTAGMKERKIESAEKGIPNSLFWIILRSNGKLIGMGRVVGDGGTVVQITDIAVDPEHQGKGYGSYIFDQIQKFILEEIPDDAFVCLFAEKEIILFYQTKGFELAQEKWPGMFWSCLDRARRKNE
jgi:N-acetylglutamate synthase-like GNAT family acetyltransferase